MSVLRGFKGDTKTDMAEPTQVTEAKANSSKAYNRGIPSMTGSTVVVLFILSWLISGVGGSLSIFGIFGMVSAQQDVLASCYGILNSSVNGIGFDPRVLKKCPTQDSPAFTVAGVETYEIGYNSYNSYTYNFGYNSSNDDKNNNDNNDNNDNNGNNGILNSSVDTIAFDTTTLQKCLTQNSPTSSSTVVEVEAYNNIYNGYTNGSESKSSLVTSPVAGNGGSELSSTIPNAKATPATSHIFATGRLKLVNTSSALELLTMSTSTAAATSTTTVAYDNSLLLGTTVPVDTATPTDTMADMMTDTMTDTITDTNLPSNQHCTQNSVVLLRKLYDAQPEHSAWTQLQHMDSLSLPLAHWSPETHLRSTARTPQWGSSLAAAVIAKKGWCKETGGSLLVDRDT